MHPFQLMGKWIKGEYQMKNVWMIRADGGNIVDDFRENSVAAIGWNALKDLSSVQDRDELRSKIVETYPEYKQGTLRSSVGQVFRFLKEIRSGDHILTYDPGSRSYYLGEVVGEYAYKPSLVSGYPHILPVQWNKESISRDSLTVPTKNHLGSTLTLFKLSKEAVSELGRVVSGEIKKVPDEEEQEVEEQVLGDLLNQSRELIKDKVNSLDWEEMQELVAGILRAMGYKTKVSSAGPDQGKDIVASPDGFGFEAPRIIVEVKHRKGTMGAPDIRSFLGGRHQDDKGLYVSTGGFTKDARYEADRASIPLSLMDIDGLVDALLNHYDKLDISIRMLVPLTCVWWPN
jgi:restriction system protein